MLQYNRNPNAPEVLSLRGKPRQIQPNAAAANAINELKRDVQQNSPNPTERYDIDYKMTSIKNYLISEYKCANRTPLDFQEAVDSLPNLNGENISNELKNPDTEQKTKREFLSCAVNIATEKGNDLTSRFNAWFKQFKLIGTESESVSGYTVLASFPDEKDPKPLFVIKIPKQLNNTEDFYNEAAAGIVALNQLKDIIPNFVYTYGYMYCNFLNVKNQPLKVCDNPGNVPYLVIESVLNSVTMGSMVSKVNMYTDEQVVNCMLQVLNASAFAQDKLKFTHYDLHDRNVLISPQQRPMYIPFILGDSQIQNTNYLLAGEHLATIIDFGLSSYDFDGLQLGRYVGYEPYQITINQSAIYDIQKIFMSIYFLCTRVKPGAYGNSKVRPNLANLIRSTMNQFYTNFMQLCASQGLTIVGFNNLPSFEYIQDLRAIQYANLINLEQQAYIRRIATPLSLYKSLFDLLNTNIPSVKRFILPREAVDKNYVYNYDNAPLPASAIASKFSVAPQISEEEYQRQLQADAEEQRRIQLIEEQRRIQLDEEQRRATDAEMQRRAAEEQRRIQYVEEQRRIQAIEAERQRQAAEAERQRQAAEEQRRIQDAEAERQRQVAEQRQRQAVEEQRRMRTQRQQQQVMLTRQSRQLEEERRRIQAEAEEERLFSGSTVNESRRQLFGETPSSTGTILIQSNKEMLAYINNVVAQYGTGPAGKAQLLRAKYNIDAGVHDIYVKAANTLKDINDYISNLAITNRDALPYLERNKTLFRTQPSEVYTGLNRLYDISLQFKPYFTMLDNLIAEINVLVQLEPYFSNMIATTKSEYTTLVTVYKPALMDKRVQLMNNVVNIKSIIQNYTNFAGTVPSIPKQAIQEYVQKITDVYAVLN
jgi:hypothetical protein